MNKRPQHEDGGAFARTDGTAGACEPWRLSPEEFLRVASRGRLHPANGVEPAVIVGTGETPLSLGESEGYPAEDIAHFYVARRTNRWQDVTPERVAAAYYQ